VRTGADYSIHAIDQDKLVDWDLIEQVVSIYDSFIDGFDGGGGQMHPSGLKKTSVI